MYFGFIMVETLQNLQHVYSKWENKNPWRQPGSPKTDTAVNAGMSGGGDQFNRYLSSHTTESSSVGTFAQNFMGIDIIKTF